MKCEKCKYQTKATSQCQFGYEQASKEFVDGNCEKFIDKYKEEYTPVIAKQIFEEIKNIAKEEIRQRQKYLDNFYGKNSKFNDTRSNWLGGKIDGIKEFMEKCIAELGKKYI